VFALMTGTVATAINGIYDTFDVTSGLGQYSVLIGQKQYPTRPIDVGANKSAVLAYLKQASSSVNGMFSSIFDKAPDMSISRAEFSYAENGTTTVGVPSKFLIGLNLETVHRSDIFSGISTQNTPLSLRITYGATANANAHNLNVVLVADAVLVIDQGFVSLKV
jgi:hypothetical protein